MSEEDQRQRYIKAHGFLKRLRQARIRLTPHEVDTLRGQAIAGDIEGAERGLKKLIERGGTRHDG